MLNLGISISLACHFCVGFPGRSSTLSRWVFQFQSQFSNIKIDGGRTEGTAESNE